MYLTYLPYLNNLHTCMYEIPPSAPGPTAGQTERQRQKKTRQQSVRHISLDLDLDLYLLLKIDTLPYLSTYLLYGKVR